MIKFYGFKTLKRCRNVCVSQVGDLLALALASGTTTHNKEYVKTYEMRITNPACPGYHFHSL